MNPDQCDIPISRKDLKENYDNPFGKTEDSEPCLHEENTVWELVFDHTIGSEYEIFAF